MPGGRCTRGSRAKKICASARKPQVQAVTTGLPCAVVLRLIRTLLGEPFRLPPSSARCEQHHRRFSAGLRGARTTRLRRPHRCRSSVRHIRVHRIPASRLVTTAIRPSAGEAGCRCIYAKTEILKSEIFLRVRVDRISRAARRANQFGHGRYPYARGMDGVP